MAPVGTLWTVLGQPTGKIIRAAAAIGGLEITIPTSYEHFVDNKKPEFLSKFPHGKIPAFEGADGFKVFEGAAIARYISALAPNSGLLGGSTEDAALVDQWVHLIESEVDAHTNSVRLLVSGQIPYNKPTHTALLERQVRSLKTLDAHLKSNTFFVGERITLADIYVAALIQKAVAYTVDAATRATLPNLIRHMETIVNQPKLKEIFGATTFTEKGIQYTPPAKEKKAEAPKASAAPKEKKPAPKKVADDDEEEDAAPPAPKEKNPLDDLPKSSFNLEDWKRAYSNMETRGAGGAIEWFYEHFDFEGFSVWRVDFKYNEELTQTFMSSNQIGGFFNRLEASRKYLFGSVGVLGTANDSRIAGTLILRGQNVEPVVSAAPDWESYEYKKLNVKNNADDKAFFEAALAWDLEVDGKKWADGKNFK